MGVKAVVYVTGKAMRAVKPRTSSNEQSADKPVWAIVAVWGTVIRSIVEVTIGASRGHSDVNGDLGAPKGCKAEQGNCNS
jgi:hypothetical protein